MKYLKSFQQINEGLTDKMTSVSDDEIAKNLDGLSIIDRFKNIKKYGLSDEFKPTNDDIINSIDKLDAFGKLDVLKLYGISDNDEVRPSEEELKQCLDNIKGKRLITTTYQVVSEESSELGDYEDQGWYDKEGESMIPDEWELYDDLTIVGKTIKFLKDKGGYEPSSSQTCNSYTTSDSEVDYTEGTDTYYSYHLNGFTDDELNLIYQGMKHDNLYESLLLEKSSLFALGVPREVMQPIQKDLALSPDVKWEKISLKREIVDLLRKGNKNLFIQIAVDNIKVIGSYPSPKGTMFFVDNYVYRDTGWAGEFEKLPREYKSLTQVMVDFDPKVNIYKMVDGDYSIKSQPKRELIKKEKTFMEFTERFKTSFLKKFDKILKRITGANFKKADKKIKDKAKKIALENEILINSLDNPLEGPNGLTILDEFLLQFEEAYTEYFGERIDIQELSKHFTEEKIMTMFMYYIYTGKILIN